ncbi:amino acid permease [Alphaproteobacteria bacterium]|nr:amino acid permease [Alphaproteobacteria bacterium]
MKYKFGLWQTTSLVVGNIVGSGILMLPAALAFYGTFGLFGWALTSLGAVFLGLVFARLSSRFTKSGGPYTYAREVFGDFFGFQIAWTYWLANIISNLAVVIAFVSYLSLSYPILKEEPTYAFGLGLISLWTAVGINLISLKIFARVQLLVTFVKVLPLIALSFVGIFYVDWSNIYPFTLPMDITPWQAILATMSLSIFSFIGIESATIPSEHVKNPKKVVAQATVIGTIISAVIYIWITVVIMGILGSATLSGSNAPFADTFGHMFGSQSAKIIALMAAFSCFSTLNGWILLQGQIPLAVAKDGLFPKLLGYQSSQGTPVVALVISSVFMSLLLLLNYSASLIDQFAMIVNLTSFSILLPYLFSGLADLVLLWREGQKKKFAWKSMTVSIIAILYALVAISGVGFQSFSTGVGLILFGVPVFLFMRKKR